MKGVERRVCSVCNTEETRELELAAHKTVTTDTATCTEAGVKETKCSVCGKVLESVTSPATDHYFVAPASDPYSAYCNRCGLTAEELGGDPGQDEVWDEEAQEWVAGDYYVYLYQNDKSYTIHLY